MKNIFKILFPTCLYVFLLILITSCDLDEISKIESVKVETETRVVLPLAFGSISMQTLIDYANIDQLIIPYDDEGYYSIDPLVTEIQIPETFTFQGSLLDVLSHLELRFESENRLPLGISIELNFIDTITLFGYGPQIDCNLIDPALIGPTGNVIESSHHVETIILTRKIISEYKNCNAITADIRFFLPQTDNDSIYLSQDDSLTINIGVVVQANSNDN